MIQTAQDRWLILFWTREDGKWVIAEAHTREDVARGQLALYRAESGDRNVRLIHTADAA